MKKQKSLVESSRNDAVEKGQESQVGEVGGGSVFPGMLEGIDRVVLKSIVGVEGCIMCIVGPDHQGGMSHGGRVGMGYVWLGKKTPGRPILNLLKYIFNYLALFRLPST